MNTRILLMFVTATALSVHADLLATRMLNNLLSQATSTALVAALEHVKKLDTAGDLKLAGEALLAMPALADQDAQRDLTANDEKNGPLGLRIRVLGIRFFAEGTSWHDARIPRECEAIMTEYADQARGKNWYAYLDACILASWYYRGGIYGAPDKAAEALERAMNYQPGNPLPIADYLTLCVGSQKKIGMRQCREKLAAYEASGAPMDQYIAYGKLLLVEADKGDVFGTALQYLKDYPNASAKALLNALKMATGAINAAKPEQIRELYTTMTTVVLRQPSDEEHVQLVAHILNEKKKLEALDPRAQAVVRKWPRLRLGE